MRKTLERELHHRVKPVVDEAVKRALGVRIAELSDDLSAKLESPIAGFVVDPAVPFKQAKKQFKREYLRKLLRINYGNISEVARISKLDRRSIHRLVKETGLDVQKIRVDMERSYDVQQQGISHLITDVLDSYKSVLHPAKLTEAYRNVSVMSKDILDHLPEDPISFDAAEEAFEEEYLRKALAANGGNVPLTAKKIGLRYETLHRKGKKFGIA